MRDALEARLLFREQMLQSLLGGKLDWEDTLEGLDDMQCGHQFAIPTPDAFSAKVQRQLATSTPPRPMLNIGWDEAMTRWKHFIDDVIDAYRMTSLDAISDPQCLQRVTWAFAYRDPPPGTFARAIMQEQLFSPGGAVVTRVGHFELLLADLRNVVLAGDSLIDPASFQIELPSDPRHIRSRLLEEFVEKAVDEYLNLYRMVCQNRCRIRRTFTQAIAILDALESEGARVDQAIASKTVGSKSAGVKKDLRPLSSWAKFHKLQVMMWTVQLGFETDIYMDDEVSTEYTRPRTTARI